MITQPKVRIYQKPLSATQSVRGKEIWILEFLNDERKIKDPIMNWTGSGDTNSSQLRLEFSTKAQALSYAKAQEYIIHLQEESTAQAPRTVIKSYLDRYK